MAIQSGMSETSDLVSLLTLLVALVAAIGGPAVALMLGRKQSRDAQKIANLQAEVQQHVANRQIVAPMRQAWINSLRDLLAEIFAKADTYRLKDAAYRSVDELGAVAILENKLRLLINPLEEDHQELITRVRGMLAYIESGHGQSDYWREKDRVCDLAQKVLKTEWNRTKDDGP